MIAGAAPPRTRNLPTSEEIGHAARPPSPPSLLILLLLLGPAKRTSRFSRISGRWSASGVSRTEPLLSEGTTACTVSGHAEAPSTFRARYQRGTGNAPMGRGQSPVGGGLHPPHGEREGTHPRLALSLPPAPSAPATRTRTRRLVRGDFGSLTRHPPLAKQHLRHHRSKTQNAHSTKMLPCSNIWSSTFRYNVSAIF